MGVFGSSMQQDFGRHARDLRLTLTSEGNFISHDFKTYLDGLMRTRLAKYNYKDYQGIEAVVVIVDFVPVPTFIDDGSAGRGGGGILWEYTLVLDVLTLSKLDFVSYTGS